MPTPHSQKHGGPVLPGVPLGNFCATLVSDAWVHCSLVAPSCALISCKFWVWVEFPGKLESVGCASTTGQRSVLASPGPASLLNVRIYRGQFPRTLLTTQPFPSCRGRALDVGRSQIVVDTVLVAKVPLLTHLPAAVSVGC